MVDYNDDMKWCPFRPIPCQKSHCLAWGEIETYGCVIDDCLLIEGVRRG